MICKKTVYKHKGIRILVIIFKGNKFLMVKCIAYDAGHETFHQLDQCLNTVCINYKLGEPLQVT